MAEDGCPKKRERQLCGTQCKKAARPFSVYGVHEIDEMVDTAGAGLRGGGGVVTFEKKIERSSNTGFTLTNSFA